MYVIWLKIFYFLKYMNNTTGDLFDKLSLLEINLNERNKEEYKNLKEKLSNKLEKCTYFYTILKEINLENSNETKRRKSIVKNKINDFFEVKYEKSHKSTHAFIATHMGNGDHLTTNGLVRYYSTLYDTVTICCYKKNLHNLEEFYADDKSIKFFPIDPLMVRSQIRARSKKMVMVKFDPSHVKEEAMKYDKFITTGFWKEQVIYDELPFCFYVLTGLNYNIFWNYFYVPTSNVAQELYNSIKDYDYIFVHNSSSLGKMFEVKTALKYFLSLNEHTLIINPCENYYSQDHKFYSVAQTLCNKSISSYKLIIENARINLVCDSSFFCFMMNLELKYNNNFLYNLEKNINKYIETFEKYSFDNKKINRKKFKLFITKNNTLNGNC